MARIAFAGSPPAAATVLRALVEAGHDIPRVISQPDRPKGRGGKTVPTAVSLEAEALGLALARPTTINAPELLDELDALDLEAVCVVGFGQLLRERILTSWPCVNVHFSILPAYRGAAPVERALMDGCTETGVTIMQMDAGLDTGPIISIGRIDVAPDENAGSILERLAVLGAELLDAALRELSAGRFSPAPQPDQGVSLAPKIGHGDIALDFAASPDEIANRVRALAPHIGAACLIGGDRVKIWSVVPHPGVAVPPGVLHSQEGRVSVACRGGSVEIRELQPPGRNRMSADAFVRGRRGGLDVATIPLET